MQDLAIIDEAHRLFDFHKQLIARPEWQGKPIIGLSATPWTRGLAKQYDDLIIAATTAELIDDGYLCDFRVFAPGHPDLSGVKTVNGDFHEGELATAMNKPPLVADIVETWLRRGENRPTLCFAVNRAHAKHIHANFTAAGIPTAYIDAYTPVAERADIERRFHAGGVKVVCNVGCLTTGVDWDVRCIILARPTKSEILFVQMIGRGLRTADTKHDCLILDHSDTHLRLGFVTDIDHQHLDDGRERKNSKREKHAPLPRECPHCSYLKPAKVLVCPACGFKPERQAAVDAVDGELVEVRGAKKAFSQAEKQSWYSQLLQIGRERGYKAGWVANQYREKFGVWPRGVCEMPAEPTAEVRNFVKSRMIAYAKRRAA